MSTQSSTTILTLANLDTMTVKAKISEADVTRVKPGLTTYFTLLGGQRHPLLRHVAGHRAGADLRRLSTSSTSSSSSSSTSSAVYYYGLFDIPNKEGKLRVSMTAQVSIVLNQAKQTLCIPLAALGEKLKDWTLPGAGAAGGKNRGSI